MQNTNHQDKIMSIKLYVGNLAFATDADALRNHFSQFGAVEDSFVASDRETGRSRGFGFVEMSDEAAAQKAIKELNGAMVDGRSMSVTVAKPREERSNNNKRSFSNSGSSNRW